MKTLAAAVLLFASVANAQAQFEAPERGRGRTPFRLQLVRAVSPTGRWQLLQEKPIQTELGLSPEAIKQIRDAQDEFLSTARTAIAKRERPSVEAVRETYVTALRNALTEDQQARLLEIFIQYAGGSALAQADIAEKIELTNEQKAAVDQAKSRSRPMVINNPEKLLEMLTPEQKAAFETMKGKPFDLTQLQIDTLPSATQPPAAQASTTPPTPNIRWEYKVEVDLHPDDLNKLGKDGWELISVTPVRLSNWKGPDGGGTKVEREKFYFKRQLKTAQER